MEGVASEVQRKKIHPQKFALWIAIASIIMMFAGLTSAYIVRQAQGNWRTYSLPVTFWISTGVILLSSGTMALAVNAFKKRYMPRYRMLIIATLILGSLFTALQYIGFQQLYTSNIRVDGNPSESFLFIIAGLHLLHIMGGIFALLFVFFRAFRTRVKVYNATGLEIVATYWHFVDVLWIYLFMFFLANQ
ncbi:MAG: alternative cytochrome c oxidase CoxO [Flavipsychrobacter sp.]|jgi:cytochrome c oxidase subunit 3|nr:alternative cytochrome c oxidase CoxO [Flavipsychrobacter sp.]